MGNINKVGIILITGFLGAGKTTFIKKYLASCGNDEKTIVIENEFGKDGIDAAILQEQNAKVTQLKGGCICCGLKVKFHDFLIELSKDYSRIIVEPSGIYTLEDFFQIMESPEVSKVCFIESILMIMDSSQLAYLDEESEKVVYSQIAGAGKIIVSKIGTQEVRKEETIDRLQNILDTHENFERNINDYILFKNWDDLTKEDFNELRGSGYFRNRINLSKTSHSMLFQNTVVNFVFPDCEQIKRYINYLFSGECGEIIRVKGYLQLEDNTKYEVNCTPHDWSLKQISTITYCGINIIGRNINRKKLQPENMAVITKEPGIK